MHFGGLGDYRKDSTAPHITLRPQLGDHRHCGLAICTFHLGFSLAWYYSDGIERRADYPRLKGQAPLRFRFDRGHSGIRHRPGDGRKRTVKQREGASRWAPADTAEPRPASCASSTHSAVTSTPFLPVLGSHHRSAPESPQWYCANRFPVGTARFSSTITPVRTLWALSSGILMRKPWVPFTRLQ